MKRQYGPVRYIASKKKPTGLSTGRIVNRCPVSLTRPVGRKAIEEEESVHQREPLQRGHGSDACEAVRPGREAGSWRIVGSGEALRVPRLRPPRRAGRRRSFCATVGKVPYEPGVGPVHERAGFSIRNRMGARSRHGIRRSQHGQQPCGVSSCRSLVRTGRRPASHPAGRRRAGGTGRARASRPSPRLRARRAVRHQHPCHRGGPGGRGDEGAVAPVGDGVPARRGHPGHRARSRDAPDGPRRGARPRAGRRGAGGVHRGPRRPDGRGAASGLRREPARLSQLHPAVARRRGDRRPRPGAARRHGPARRRGRVRGRAVRGVDGGGPAWGSRPTARCT